MGMVFIVLLMTNAGMHREYSVKDLLLIYLMFHTANNFFFMFFLGFLLIPEMIMDGSLDLHLSRPYPLLIDILLSNLSLTEFPGILFNITVIFAYCLGPVNVIVVILVIFIPLFTSLILAGLALGLSSLGFLFPSMGTAVNFIFPVSELGEYPISVYPKPLRCLLTIVPIGFISYYPSLFVLQADSWKYLLFTFIAVLCSVLVGLTVFHVCIKKYKSRGT
jgi:ABC-2 type transport system permease protein